MELKLEENQTSKDTITPFCTYNINATISECFLFILIVRQDIKSDFLKLSPPIKPHISPERA